MANSVFKKYVRPYLGHLNDHTNAEQFRKSRGNVYWSKTQKNRELTRIKGIVVIKEGWEGMREREREGGRGRERNNRESKHNNTPKWRGNRCPVHFINQTVNSNPRGQTQDAQSRLRSAQGLAHSSPLLLPLCLDLSPLPSKAASITRWQSPPIYLLINLLTINDHSGNVTRAFKQRAASTYWRVISLKR